MDWTSYERMCEDAAYGQYLIETIAENLGIEANADRIDRAIYKGTDCGAWVRFDEHGIMVGTIVEGSDAEYSERVKLDDDPNQLVENFWAAVQRCEDFADDHWGKDETCEDVE